MLDVHHGVVDGLCNVLNVVGVDASHRDAAVFQKVDVPLVNQQLALALGQSCEREHTNLIGDVIPRTRGAQLFNGTAKLTTHVVDAVSHEFDFSSPLRAESIVAQDAIDLTRNIKDSKQNTKQSSYYHE